MSHTHWADPEGEFKRAGGVVRWRHLGPLSFGYADRVVGGRIIGRTYTVAVPAGTLRLYRPRRRSA